jgi:hypothetical protein
LEIGIGHPVSLRYEGIRRTRVMYSFQNYLYEQLIWNNASILQILMLFGFKFGIQEAWVMLFIVSNERILTPQALPIVRYIEEEILRLESHVKKVRFESFAIRKPERITIITRTNKTFKMMKDQLIAECHIRTIFQIMNHDGKQLDENAN